jgi:hypothetical protein
MKPSILKTVRECSVAAHVVFEARVVVAAHTGRVTSPLDNKLHKLEKSYWTRADEIARELSVKKKSPPKSRRAGKRK